jgi:hypothetical protein
MNHSTEPGHKPGSQPRPEIPLNPTIQQMKDFDEDQLLWWIKQKKPTLLSGDDLETFIAAKIVGEGFLDAAKEMDGFMKAGLVFGVSQRLAMLGQEVMKGGEFILWT